MSPQLPLALALAALALGILGEALHAARARRVAHLAFGPPGRPRPWTLAAPFLRAVAAAATTWGLATLLLLPPKVHQGGEEVPLAQRGHIVLVLDVSPSMRLADAGAELTQLRLQRVRDLLTSLLARVPVERFRLSVIAVYNGAKRVVEDTQDLEVVHNILDGLPMHHAFTPGPTRIADGLAEAVKLARPWNPGSTTLVLMTDGDTVAHDVPALPPSIAEVLVVGVGDVRAGKFIAGRQSRQDAGALARIAGRLNGTYHDGNQKHIPSAALSDLVRRATPGPLDRLGLREYALVAVAAGAALLALLPAALQALGTGWRPGVRVHEPSEQEVLA